MLHVQVWKIIVHIFSDDRQTHDGNFEHADNIGMYDSMGKLEHVIFTIHSPIIIIYILQTTCKLAGCVILTCIKLYCILFISHVWYLYQISF